MRIVHAVTTSILFGVALPSVCTSDDSGQEDSLPPDSSSQQETLQDLELTPSFRNGLVFTAS